MARHHAGHARYESRRWRVKTRVYTNTEFTWLCVPKRRPKRPSRLSLFVFVILSIFILFSLTFFWSALRCAGLLSRSRGRVAHASAAPLVTAAHVAAATASVEAAFGGTSEVLFCCTYCTSSFAPAPFSSLSELDPAQLRHDVARAPRPFRRPRHPCRQSPGFLFGALFI
jgi:hypothetical protein